MRRILSVCLVVMAVLAAPSVAVAQKVTEQFKKEMPEVELLPEAELKEQANLVVEDGLKDKALHFNIHIPKDWSETSKGGLGNLEISNKILGQLREFYGPPDIIATRSRLSIDAMGMDYAMSADQWFMQFLLENGYSLQGFKVHDSRRAEALYVLIEDQISYAVRAVAQINGANVLFVQHFVPIERWHDEKKMQASILNSFQITDSVETDVEEMETYHFLDIAEFQYPVSWQLRSFPIRSIDRMKVQLVSVVQIDGSGKDGVKRLDGQISIDLVSIFASETLESEVEVFKDDLGKKGLSMGELLEVRDDFLFGDRYDFVDTQVFKVSDEKSRLIDYELWLTVMSAGDYYYFVSLFTPSRDEDYFKWVRNVETYKLVIGEVVPNTSGGISP